MKSYPVSM